jgi:hypothetical protein
MPTAIIKGGSHPAIVPLRAAVPLSGEWLNALKVWFCRFSGSYLGKDPVHDFHIDLKRGHSLRVCAIMRRLGRSLGLTKTELILGQALGLLHDLGRFDQYDQYRTFRDPFSLDHGGYGATLIASSGLLRGLSPDDREALLTAVRHHNKVLLHDHLQGRLRFWAELIRDADKLDIWEIVTIRYRKKPLPVGFEPESRLSEASHASAAVLEALRTQRCVPTAALRTRGDYALFHMGWVYDVNQDAALTRVLARGYLERLHDSLPGHADLDAGYRWVCGYVQARLWGRQCTVKQACGW